VSQGQRSETSSLDRLASVDLNLLVPLLALLEERSVTRAAARMGLSQPAMSHALARSRRLLDDDLLVRQGTSMTLTPRAAELVLPLRRALDHAARVVRFPGFDATTDPRAITVAMTTSTAFVIGGHLARLIAERAPHATLRIRTFTVPDESVFTDGGVDVVLLPEAFASPFPRERLYDDRWVVIAATDAAAADASAVDLLRTLPHVVFEGSRRRVTPYLVLDEQHITYTVRQVVPDNVLIPTLVAHVGGVALHRHSFVTAMAEVLPLRVEEFPFPVPGLGIDLVWNPRLADDSFITWLRAVLHEAAGEGHAAYGSRP
jgi:DNA-binding transcriptional LysR family regulator